MTNTYTYTLDVDVTNPGQYYTCCGLLVLSHNFSTLKPTAYFERNNSKGHNFIIENLSIPMKEILTNLDPIKNKAPNRKNLKGGFFDYSKGYVFNFGENKTFKIHLRNSYFKLWTGNAGPWTLLNCSLDSQNLFQYTTKGNKLGYDAKISSHNRSNDFSMNDSTEKFWVCPAIELLSFIAFRYFEPELDSDKVFSYYTWSKPLPIELCVSASVYGTPYFYKMSKYITNFKVTKAKDSEYKTFNYAKEEKCL